jgi:hypothetical protein
MTISTITSRMKTKISRMEKRNSGVESQIIGAFFCAYSREGIVFLILVSYNSIEM